MVMIVMDLDEEFEYFFNNLPENDRIKLSLIPSSTAIKYIIPKLSGYGKKKYHEITQILISEVISRSNQPINKMYMCELWMLYNMSKHNLYNLKTSQLLDNISIKELLLAQNMIWKYNNAKGIWKLIKDTLEKKGFTGICLPDNANDLDNLYRYIKINKSLDGTKATTNYVTISYVQTKAKNDMMPSFWIRTKTKNDMMPSFWSSFVIGAVKKIRNLGIFNNSDIGIWWDKLASIQYKGSQSTWPATANLQFPTHLTIVCLPLAIKEDYDVQLWSDILEVDNLIEECKLYVCDNVQWIEECKTFVSPVLARRCWPYMEIRLANMNIGAFTTVKHIGFIVDTIHIFMLIWCKCNKLLNKEIDTECYNMYLNQYEYIKIEEDCKCNACLEMHQTIKNIINQNQLFKSIVVNEIISILGILTSLIANIKIIELYNDEDKKDFHPKVKKLVENTVEYNFNQDHNIQSIKEKFDLSDWEPDTIAVSINEILNGYSHSAKCYSDVDKIMAAIVLMDLELTQNVLQEWSSPETHPFAKLFTEKNWEKICRSDNMDRLTSEANIGPNTVQNVSKYWLGCMQSQIKGDIFIKLKNIYINDSTLDKMLATMQKVFKEKVNIKGVYFKNINKQTGCGCCGKQNDSDIIDDHIKQTGISYKCLGCCGKQKDGDIIGRYTLLATKQWRGIEQGILYGDTQIVIIENNNVSKIGKLLLTTNNTDYNKTIKWCVECNGMNTILYDGSNNLAPLGIVTVYYLSI